MNFNAGIQQILVYKKCVLLWYLIKMSKHIIIGIINCCVYKKKLDYKKLQHTFNKRD